MQQTTNGGYIFAGSTNSLGANHSVAWLSKRDAYGIELWNKTFGGLGNDSAASVQQTNDGGYILTGTTTSFGAGGSDAWLIKTDAYGNKQWDKTFGGSGNDSATSVQQTNDGGYIITGYTQYYGLTGGGVWLIKTDSNGNVNATSLMNFDPPIESSSVQVFRGSISGKDLQTRFINLSDGISRLSVNMTDEGGNGDIAFLLLDPYNKRVYAKVGSEFMGLQEIILPKPGKWQIWIYGNNVPASHNESYSVVITQYLRESR